VRSRLLVVAAFLAMAAVPTYLAWSTGLLPGPQQASAESTGPSTTSSAAVAPLVWPEEPLGLTAGETRIYWEQRDRSADVAGLWYHDVPSGDTERLLGRHAAGNSGGFPAAGGHLVAWESWAGRRGDGPARIQALNLEIGHLWRLAKAGRAPRVVGDAVFWVDPDGAGPGKDVIRGLNALTDEEYTLETGDRVRSFAAWGPWVVWISGNGPTGEVWAGSLRNATRFRLAARGTAVAMDRERVLWAASAGRHSTAIVSWNRRSSSSKVLCRLRGAGSSLSLSSDAAAWVVDRKATGPQVWSYDFELGKATPVSEAGGRQVSPVIVADSVYWADDRSGRWELYSHSLSH
jgi:hypothetical protein